MRGHATPLNSSGAPTYGVAMGASIVHRRRGPGWLESEWRDVFLLRHRDGPADGVRLHAMTQALDAFARGRASIDLVVVASGGPPTLDARQPLIALLRDQAPTFGRVLVWIQTSGLLGSFARSVATGLFMIDGRVAARFVGSRADLAAALASRGPRDEVEALLREVLDAPDRAA